MSTPPVAHHSDQTFHLFRELGHDGFAIVAELPSFVAAADGYVINRALGIWVHADTDMVRLIVDERPDHVGYRLVLGRRDLRAYQALDIICMHARAACAAVAAVETTPLGRS